MHAGGSHDVSEIGPRLVLQPNGGGQQYFYNTSGKG